MTDKTDTNATPATTLPPSDGIGQPAPAAEPASAPAAVTPEPPVAPITEMSATEPPARRSALKRAGDVLMQSPKPQHYYKVLFPMAAIVLGSFATYLGLKTYRPDLLPAMPSMPAPDFSGWVANGQTVMNGLMSTTTLGGAAVAGIAGGIGGFLASQRGGLSGLILNAFAIAATAVLTATIKTALISTATLAVPGMLPTVLLMAGAGAIAGAFGAAVRHMFSRESKRGLARKMLTGATVGFFGSFIGLYFADCINHAIGNGWQLFNDNVLNNSLLGGSAPAAAPVEAPAAADPAAAPVDPAAAPADPAAAPADPAAAPADPAAAPADPAAAPADPAAAPADPAAAPAEPAAAAPVADVTVAGDMQIDGNVFAGLPADVQAALIAGPGDTAEQAARFAHAAKEASFALINVAQPDGSYAFGNAENLKDGAALIDRALAAADAKGVTGPVIDQLRDDQAWILSQPNIGDTDANRFGVPQDMDKAVATAQTVPERPFSQRLLEFIFGAPEAPVRPGDVVAQGPGTYGPDNTPV